MMSLPSIAFAREKAGRRGSPMRGPACILLVLLLAACGSDSSTDSPPEDVAGAPATITIIAGTGQQALPGTKVPVNPVVVVKDDKGRPVSGVKVFFAVDSGGGTLEASSDTTAKDGTASPGDWTLGPDEARNVLRVTVDTLPPVWILAVGAAAPESIPDLKVGAEGGTIMVDMPGAPIDGMEILVPENAFKQGQTVSITYGSALGVTVPAGVAIVSPLISFRVSDGGIAESPMLITVPVAVPPGSKPAILLLDSAGLRRELMTTLAWSDTSVTGVSAHLNGALLAGKDGSLASPKIASRKAAAKVAAGSATAVVIAIPDAILAQDHDTGFRPGVDNWEFRPIGTVLHPDISLGMVVTAAWYYEAKKAGHGSLWKMFQEADGIEESNRLGLRWTSVARIHFAPQVLLAAYAAQSEILKLSLADTWTAMDNMSSASFNSARAALTLAPGSPLPAILFPRDTTMEDHQVVLVYRSSGQKLFAIDPGSPDKTIELDFSSGLMEPVAPADGGTPYTRFHAAGLSLLANISAMQSQWSAVENGTIGDDIFPKYRMKAGWGSTESETADLADTVFVLGAEDPIGIWADCTGCFGEPRPSTFPPGEAQVARFSAYKRAAAPGEWSDLGVGTRLLAAEAGEFGFAVWTRPTPDDEFEWTDWKSIRTRQIPATLAPDAPTVDVDAEVELKLTLKDAPGNLEYAWDFAEGGAPAITSVPAATHQWTSGGNYAVKVTARDKTTRQPVAKASAQVTVEGGLLAWRFTSLDLAFSTVGPDVNSDVKWRIDSTRFQRMRNGGSQGGIRLVEKAFIPTGLPVRTAVEGLYLLEGASLTTETASYPPNNGIFAAAPFAGADLKVDSVPWVNAWELIRVLQTTPEPVCKDPSESFTRTGSADGGRVAGLTVQYCWDRFTPPQPGFGHLVGPRITIAADVTFAGATAGGTITLTYLFQQPSGETQKKIATATFTATRL